MSDRPESKGAAQVPPLDGRACAPSVPDTALPGLLPTPPPEPSLATGEPGLATGYQEVTAIGEGGMGVVYRGFDPRLRRWVALKVLRFPRADLLARFRTEAEAVARLRHPHVVQVFALEQHQGQPCLVMEYVPGGSLEQQLGHSRLPWGEAARLVAVLARAVQAAHAAGVVHRDLKPANVLMAPPVEGSPGNVMGGFPKVSDFGLARLSGDAGQTGSGQVLGTPHYLSPEQALGKKEVGPPTDVWALGVILYRCLTAGLPFDADSVLETLDKVRLQEPKSPREFCTAVPVELEALCLRCMSKETANRPTAGELAEALERLVDRTAEAVLTPRQDAARSPGERTRRVGVWLYVVVALLTASATGTYWYATRTHKPTTVQPRKPGETDKVLTVRHWRERRGTLEPWGEVGNESASAAYGDHVRIEAAFAEPTYAYLIAFNADGKEQLLWPTGEQAKPDENVEPPAMTWAKHPHPDRGAFSKNKRPTFVLDDEKRGGVQAFAVVASSKPLPSYAASKRQRGPAAWKREPKCAGVWICQEGKTYSLLAGRILDRGSEGTEQGEPPLEALSASLKRAGAESVEVIAFWVRPKEGE